ncbi:DUF6069 family protein [Streptomyces sp. SL13]|uniref:DUF6069 family protein n=1 Tax=Streptantibioticus silvisoli TaxID=2705255 RepID=A0AA90KF27_9ACTN|nr:DUF6069 family protein [Streptantibioticus silvisoli]MDI5963000.1 DUF6069 family protein [Streptantibioticus silvisoli]MDI5968715.1 DUF6069 family protein [Streptantibioticus silvisoli]
MTTPPAPHPETNTRRARLLAVLAGMLAAFVVWLVTAQFMSVDLATRTGSGAKASTTKINVAVVIVAALIAGLLAWGLLALLERRMPGRARTVWTTIAAVVLLLSLAAPLSEGVGTGAKVALLCMHLVTGGVLIPALARTSARA